MHWNVVASALPSSSRREARIQPQAMRRNTTPPKLTCIHHRSYLDAALLPAYLGAPVGWCCLLMLQLERSLDCYHRWHSQLETTKPRRLLKLSHIIFLSRCLSRVILRSDRAAAASSWHVVCDIPSGQRDCRPNGVVICREVG